MCARRSTPRHQSQAGSLLLSNPTLRDPNFAKTVILLSVHDTDGAMGIVLNRPTGKTLAALGGALAAGALAEVPIFTGGPVQTEQLLICAWRIDAEKKAGFQLHFGIEPARAAELLAEPGMHVRAFLGYAGWSSGQLETELNADAWAVTEIPENLMEIGEGVDLWTGLLGEIGHEWVLWAEEPDDPSGN